MFTLRSATLVTFLHAAATLAAAETPTRSTYFIFLFLRQWRSAREKEKDKE